MYIGDWIDRGALYWPDRLAVVDVARGAAGRFTYRQLKDRAARLAGWLRTAGVGRGDRVALLGHNGVEYLDTLFACARLGALFMPCNWRLHPRELAEIACQLGPSALLFSAEFREGAAAMQEGALRRDERGPLLTLAMGTSAYEAALSGPPLPPQVELREEDLACLLFTGGTTGTPKAAQISYRMIAWNTLTTLVHELDRGDVTVVHTPMFHTGGLLVYALPLLTVGGTVVIMRRWDPEELLRLIPRERITMFFCVPTQYQQLLLLPGFAVTDFSSVRFLTSGGAPLPVPLIGEFTAVHQVPFKQGFGMTEFGPGAFSMGPEFAVTKAGSIGRPNTFVEALVVGEDGRQVPAGQVGELWLRGPACFSGYYQQPEATAEALDAERWLHTGDLARVDDDGFYYIAGRKKDMFLSGGENVYPLEIERALYEHPGVQQCAVIGAPDERWGQVGRAFVVRREGSAVTEAEILSFLRDRLARYKVPKSVRFLDHLPLSAAGKILKRELAGK